MATSKRVINAKSERHYKSTGPLGKKRQVSWWKALRKQMSTHPWMVVFLMSLTVMSGIVGFLMNEKTSRSMFGGTMPVEQ